MRLFYSYFTFLPQYYAFMTLLYMYLIPGIPLGINHVYPKGSPCAPFNIKIDYTKNIVLIHNVNAIDYWVWKPLFFQFKIGNWLWKGTTSLKVLKGHCHDFAQNLFLCFYYVHCLRNAFLMIK